MVDRRTEDTDAQSSTPVRRCASADPGRARIDEALRLLSHHRRRDVLYYLADHDLASLDALATTVVCRETGVSSERVDAAERDPVLVDLYHNHVPKLADCGLVEYDRRSGAIRWSASTPVETLLECSRELEGEIDHSERRS
ncbi:DUF7344 domain-containing protein [Natronobiforma cellulositropha]|uniref:DUF7344 domain-containing protein n=1 Tax=Natronobiforma cellulositropha TaxID=1679076 RepID=UPI0021D5B0B6|nr:hypothetical protein [Natronobiforma cellulositropha]